jgi:hypothetical protein
MSAFRQRFERCLGLLLAGKRLIGSPILDIQHENPRGVGKGRLLTPSWGASEIRQREPAGTEYSEVNESAGYRDVADESVFHHRAHFR